MTGDRSVPLAGELKVAAERFFHADLSDVVLHYGDHAQSLGAVACACGHTIHVSRRFHAGSQEERELLGHELAHIVQQRQGRVRRTAAIAGDFMNDDPALEREAVEAGWRFAHGMESTMPRLPMTARWDAVIQRAVVVGGHALSSMADLSNAVGIVLELIDGGPSWMKWAINNRTVSYHYADEGSLLEGTQSGLHGTELMLLSNLKLQVHPLKLVEMQPDDLNVVSTAQNEAVPHSVTQIQTKKILVKYQLLSQAELDIGSEFLGQTGVATNPVFQGMSLTDRVALFNLVDSASSEISLNPMIQREAAEFAVSHAQCPGEFVDYYQFYAASVDEAEPNAKGAASRSRKVETARESLEPLLYGSLFCPSVQGVPSPEQMNVIIQNWVAAGNDLGFSRLSLALAQVGQFASLNGATGVAASRLIEQYFEQAQLFLPQRPAGLVTLTQDGLDHYYLYDSTSALAQVCLSSTGNITLATYQPKALTVKGGTDHAKRAEKR